MNCDTSRVKWQLFGGLLLLAAMVQQTVVPDDRLPEYYRFNVSWDDAYSSVISMGDTVRQGSEWRRGRVKVSGDKIIAVDGRDKRFWGIAVDMSKEFPPVDKVETKRFIAKLAKYGFNLVRLNALDFKRLSLYKYWLENRSFDAEVMDRLDYFIYELRNAGIYYSISINNASLKGIYGGKIAPNEHPVRHKKYKYVQLYDERIVQPVLQWHIDFYKHKNPYTGVTYAKDPANLYVTAVGEDSLFNGYFRRNAKNLGVEQLKRLNAGYEEFVAQRSGMAIDADSDDWRRGKLEQTQTGLVKPNELSELEVDERRNLVRYLYSLDEGYALRVDKALTQTGYTGLFAVTNDWYGYANLLLNAKVGDFIDMHGYFDPLLRVRSKEGGTRAEMVRNTSYLASPYYSRDGDIRPLEANFYRYFASAVENKPLLISEWNHSAWSRFAYEGPVMLTAYAALQGWSGMVIHTLHSNDIGFKSGYSTNSLAASGNPVLMSLSPTLALATIKGYIKESDVMVPITLAPNEEELLDAVLTDRLDPLRRKNGVSYNEGFVHKVRVRLFGEKAQANKKRVQMGGGVWRSDTGEIAWYHHEPDEALLTVDAPKFQAALGRLDNVSVKLKNVDVSLKEHGAVTAIALDDELLTESKSVLFTAVSSFKNTGAVNESVRQHKAWRNLTKVVNPGRGPTMMKRVVGNVVFRSKNRNTPQVYGVAVNGDLLHVKTTTTPGQDGMDEVRFKLGSVDTPWYWVSYLD